MILSSSGIITLLLGPKTRGPSTDFGLVSTLVVDRRPSFPHIVMIDHCDGTYDSYCDRSRELTNVTAVSSFPSLSLQGTYVGFVADPESRWAR
jgi:hypothetical protein